MKIITDLSRKVKYNYFIEDTYDVGIILQPWEIKSIRVYGFQISGSYATFINNECTLIGSYIKSNRQMFFDREFDERRNRKILLLKKELKYLKGILTNTKKTLIPSKVFWKGNFVKLSLSLATGKKKYDKKETSKKDNWLKIEIIHDDIT